MSKISIYQYVCENSPQKCLDLIETIGTYNPRNTGELAQVMQKIMRSNDMSKKRELMAGLVEIHPDYDLFMETHNFLQEENKKQIVEIPTKDLENKYSCTGCGGSCGGAKMSATGETTPESNIDLKMQIASIQNESTTNKLIADKIFKIVVATGVLFLLFKAINKAN